MKSTLVVAGLMVIRFGRLFDVVDYYDGPNGEIFLRKHTPSHRSLKAAGYSLQNQKVAAYDFIACRKSSMFRSKRLLSQPHLRYDCTWLLVPSGPLSIQSYL